METKSFLVEEHSKTIFSNEEIDQWSDLVQVLGLEKQAALMNNNSSPSPLPFPLMIEAEERIYETVFDIHKNYKEYSEEAIPLKILSLIALCEKEKYFDKIEIWYSRAIDDPIVIGLRYESEEDEFNNRAWNMIRHMIGAWGEKLKSAIDLLPSWDDYQRKQITENYEYNLKDHNLKVERFKFQLNAFQQPVKTKK